MVETLLGDTAIVPVFMRGYKVVLGPHRFWTATSSSPKKSNGKSKLKWLSHGQRLRLRTTLIRERRLYTWRWHTPHRCGPPSPKSSKQAIGGTKLMKASEDMPTKDDVLEGMAIAVSVRIPNQSSKGKPRRSCRPPLC